jgi:hypothetical protein
MLVWSEKSKGEVVAQMRHLQRLYPNRSYEVRRFGIGYILWGVFDLGAQKGKTNGPL